MHGAAHRGDFLKVQSFDQGDELVLSVIKSVVHETISEQDGIVSKFDLTDGVANTNFELLLGFNSVTNASAQLLETRRIDEQEVSFNSLAIDLDSAFNIDLNDRDLAFGLDALQLVLGCAVETVF